MRRRWKALVAVGAVALLAALLFLLPPRDDGLDWARKYGGKERTIRLTTADTTGKVDMRVTLFNFDSIPKGFEAELRGRFVRYDVDHDGEMAGDTREGQSLYYSRSMRRLYYTHETESSWLARKWREFRKKVGWGA